MTQYCLACYYKLPFGLMFTLWYVQHGSSRVEIAPRLNPSNAKGTFVQSITTEIYIMNRRAFRGPRHFVPVPRQLGTLFFLYFSQSFIFHIKIPVLLLSES